jgi:hypothetical protein
MIDREGGVPMSGGVDLAALAAREFVAARR